MKIINAHWEKRNLGVSCTEIIFEEKDSSTDFKTKVLNITSEYLVVKIPVGRIDLSSFLQENNFKFIELITSCFHKPELPELPKVYDRLINKLLCEEMNEVERQETFSRIKEGLFVDDRVSLDPAFNKDQSNLRYVGWINDEIGKGSIFYKIVYREKIVGFFNMRNIGNDIFHASIGGVFPEFQSAGFGVCMNYLQIAEALKHRAKRVYSSFSSNNRGAFGVHLLMSYTLDKQYYVFVKHK